MKTILLLLLSLVAMNGCATMQKDLSYLFSGKSESEIYTPAEIAQNEESYQLWKHADERNQRYRLMAAEEELRQLREKQQFQKEPDKSKSGNSR